MTTDTIKNSDLTVMSNFDHLVDKKVERTIKASGEYALYSGWNFCGYVWWNDPDWFCEVWVYGECRETIWEETLEDIMAEVSEKYGWA